MSWPFNWVVCVSRLALRFVLSPMLINDIYDLTYLDTADSSSMQDACHIVGRDCVLMVSTLDSRSIGLGSSTSRGHCIVFFGKTLYSHSASLHPGTSELNAGGNPGVN